MNARLLTAMFLMTMLVIGDGLAAEIIGKVVGLHDGDSIKVRVPDSDQLKVRLEGIDAPELGAVAPFFASQGGVGTYLLREFQRPCCRIPSLFFDYVRRSVFVFPLQLL